MESVEASGGRRLLSRPARRQMILDGAARAFARNGYSATGLDEVAAEAGISKVLLYRHFASKTDLYRAVLEASLRRMEAVLAEFPGRGNEAWQLEAIVQAASADPDGYRLVADHAPREPEFADFARQYAATSAALAEEHLRDHLPDLGRRRWMAEAIPEVVARLILSWLDAGRPTSEAELVATLRRTGQALVLRT